MRLIVQIAAIYFIIGTMGAYNEVLHAQETPGAHIRFSEPSKFQCGGNIPWSSLSGWQGERGKCGNGLLYTVVGNSTTIKEGFIKSKIAVPEDNYREWPPYNGAVQEINDGIFKVQFCITSRTVTRPIWFQAYSKDGKKVGSRCAVVVVGVQLED